LFSALEVRREAAEGWRGAVGGCFFAVLGVWEALEAFLPLPWAFLPLRNRFWRSVLASRGLDRVERSRWLREV
jgi:hypothetical protein